MAIISCGDLLGLSSGDGSDNTDDPIVDPLVGAWHYEDDSAWWVINADGTMASSEFLGTWTADEHSFTLDYSFRIVDGVRTGLSGTRTWSYALIGDKFYKDSTPFVRVGTGTGLSDTFERAEYRDDMQSWVKVQVVLSADPGSIVYRMYANIGDDYDFSTGTGTWGADPVFGLTGDIAVLPSAQPGVIYELVLSGIDPVTPDFPDGTYTFLLYTEDILGIELIGMVPFTYTAPVTPTVYAGGYCEDDTGVSVPGYWQDLSWHALPPLASDKDAWVSDVIVSGTDVYASGWCKDASGVKVAGYWKNGVWNSLQAIDSSNDAEAVSIVVREGTAVHIGGYSVDSSGVMVPVHWRDGTDRYRLPKTDPTQDGQVLSTLLDPLTGNIYNAGRNEGADGKSLPGYWLYTKFGNESQPENSVWIDLDHVDGIDDYTITSLYLAGTDVYACGYGVNASGITRGVYWVNKVPTEETTETTTDVSRCEDLQVVAGHVYSAGMVTSSTGDVLGVVRKDGTDGPDNAMYDLPALSEPKKTGAADIEILNTDVYVGGYSVNASDIAVPGLWINRVWVELPRISTGKPGYVNSLFILE